MAIRVIGDPVPAIRAGTVENPSAGLDPARLTEDVSAKTCQVFSPKKKNKEGKTVVGRSFKGSCPITWAWKDGGPALRFCHAKSKAGRIIPVKDGEDAMVKAAQICADYRQRSAGVQRDAEGLSREYEVIALAMSDSELSQYSLGRLRRKKPKRRQR